jgi:sulfur dioxygenase
VKPAFLIALFQFAVSTHMHSDHTKAVQKLKKYLPECKTAISAASGAIADILVRHGDIIHFGRHNLEVRATPGHTNCNLIKT